MPYYNWVGIDWFGNVHSGKYFARSEADLSKLLLSKEIGLIKANKVIHKSLFRPIGFSNSVNFFKELSILVDSGVLLPNALSITKHQVSNNRLKKVIEEIEFEVREGKTFSRAISNYPYLFDYLIVQIITAGEESGKLGRSLILLSSYLEKREKFNQRLRSVLILPFITFSLFIFITLIIFLFIIPSFSSIITFSNQNVPALTKKLLDISSFLRNKGLIVISIAILSFAILINRVLKVKKAKLLIDKFLLKMPFIGSLIKFLNLTYFLQSLSLMINGGIHLLNSLELTGLSIKNEFFKNNFHKLYKDVQQGNSLSHAMTENKNNLFFPNLIAMIKVGEESGNLDEMLTRASIFYFEKSERLINFFLTVLQPILLIILGLMIALLIFAVYIPMFNLPNIVGN